MLLKKLSIFLLGIVLLKPLIAQDITASMNKVKVTFMLTDNGIPEYSVTYGDKVVIEPSTLGFKLTDDKPLDANFELIGKDVASHDNTWKPVWGETSKIRDHYNEVKIHLRQKNTGRLLDIVFRVFEDGVGFRYEFPKQSKLKYFIISDELTQFCMTGDHKSFWIPGDYDSNEYPYTTSKLSEVDNKSAYEKNKVILVRTVVDYKSVQTPLMMKTNDGLYINIHEAALVNYPAMQLHVDNKTFQLTAELVPDAYGNKAYLHAPSHTPWRTIIVSDKATDILASKMILNLNDSLKITNTSWIKPMKFVGVWWEMQTGKSTWTYSNNADSTDANGQLIPSGTHGANTANVKKYIDFAAANGIGGVLVEGWNTGWEDAFGTWKENDFDFVTPYPDFDVKALQQYAAQKGVHMIMHNETCGSATNYERQMDTAFRFMNKYGYTAVKTGYVGKIIPRGEHHDGQWMVNHYLRSIQKAAQYHVMIDIHEPMRPTGLQRTYPNFLACEAGRGNEYHAFDIGNALDHLTILPFTRLMGGPMDYTPGIFKIKNYETDSSRQVNSTLAKQLALYITVYSPLQMAADLPENYEAHMDAFQFIKDVPVDWDDTKILAAEPGDYVAIARKGKGTDSWFIGAVTNEDARELTADLSFLDKDKKYVATLYADAANADWQKNPEAYTITQFIVNDKTQMKLKMANGGGEAVSIIPATEDQIKKLKWLKL